MMYLRYVNSRSQLIIQNYISELFPHRIASPNLFLSKFFNIKFGDITKVGVAFSISNSFTKKHA